MLRNALTRRSQRLGVTMDTDMVLESRCFSSIESREQSKILQRTRSVTIEIERFEPKDKWTIQTQELLDEGSAYETANESSALAWNLRRSKRIHKIKRGGSTKGMQLSKRCKTI